jgi:LmbE family N-acetylglucosaminyl deacetylase
MNVVKPSDLRVLVVGAHPDDADLTAGGLVLNYVRAGATVKLLALCNGDKGHATESPSALAARRREEARRSGRILGAAAYQVLDSHDCELVADLATRREVTRIIRSFAPHLVFTHRTCDYHPDHRAAGTLVMDASYLLGVPLWCPESPVPKTRPAIYFLRDNFSRPAPFRPDVVVDVDDVMPQLLEALCSHESQFFEWLVFDMKIEEPVPSTPEGRRAFIERHWIVPRKAYDADRFRSRLEAVYGKEKAGRIRYAEAFELSEYGYQPTPEETARLFPFAAD